MNSPPLRESIDTLKELLDAIYDRDPQWRQRGKWPKREIGTVLLPPASPQQLAVCRRQKPPLPPSYLQFLELHDGWLHFWLDFTLIGTGGRHTADVQKTHEEYARWQRTEHLVTSLPKATPTAVANWEAEDETNLFIQNHRPLGTTFGGELLLLDARTLRPNGEMDIVYWTLDYGVWEDRRFHDFGELLRWATDSAATTLKKLGGAKSKKKATAKAPPRKPAAAPSRPKPTAKKLANKGGKKVTKKSPPARKS